ncbi:unnamed protein product [Adineta steineri]|uniref:Condensation domain-containing protein n=1 Tax=Adineta steineri TaxID=433720 RepID=A0A815JM40_9BILA|nr:unnamed protein product [Adineta steineri]
MDDNAGWNYIEGVDDNGGWNYNAARDHESGWNYIEALDDNGGWNYNKAKDRDVAWNHNEARDSAKSHLDGLNLERHFAHLIDIPFGNDLIHSFLDYASSQDITPFQLGLTIFYTFLYKLSHNHNDLCISCIHANRYKTELQNLTDYKHSSAAFLNILFDFITYSSDTDLLSVNQTQFQPVPLKQMQNVVKFDMKLLFFHDPTVQNQTISCSLICSQDVFDIETVEELSKQFQPLLSQLFVKHSSSTKTTSFDLVNQSISKLSFCLENVPKEIQQTIFHRLPNIKNEGPASYAQSRIWFDERIRFDRDKPQVAINNMPFLYRLHSQHTLSTTQLHHALQLILIKHQSLRTSIIFDMNKNLLMQKIIDHIDNKELFTFIESTFETDEDLNKIMHNERGNPKNFNLMTGVVCRCHIVYYKNISQKGIICEKDAVISNFHHALFDFLSMKMFCQDLDQAYTMGYLENDDNTTLRYLDSAVAEQQIPMTAANTFWLDALRDCEIDRPLQLSFDRHRIFDEHRTGRGSSISFQFDNDLSKAFLTYASTYNIKLEYLALASY